MCCDVAQIRSVLLIPAGLFRIITGADQTSKETAKTAVHASRTPHRGTCHRSRRHRNILSGRLHSHYTGIDPHYNLLLPRPHPCLSVPPTAPSVMHGNRKDGTLKENPFPLKNTVRGLYIIQIQETIVWPGSTAPRILYIGRRFQFL